MITLKVWNEKLQEHEFINLKDKQIKKLLKKQGVYSKNELDHIIIESCIDSETENKINKLEEQNELLCEEVMVLQN